MRELAYTERKMSPVLPVFEEERVRYTNSFDTTTRQSRKMREYYRKMRALKGGSRSKKSSESVGGGSRADSD